jgi:hypothetical protein
VDSIRKMGKPLFELNKITILDQTAIGEIRNALVAWYNCVCVDSFFSD